MFPPVFCVSTPGAGPVAVFSAIQIRPRVYSVAPYRILHGSNGVAMPEEAWSMDGRFGGHPSHISNDPLRLIAYHPEHGELTFEGTWVHCGTTVFSMYCGAAIPILAFNRHLIDETTATGFREENGLQVEWFRLCNGENLLPIIEGSRRDIRRWVERWNPISWSRETEDIGAGGRGRSPVRTVPEPVVRTAPLPKYVADLLIRDAENRNTTCPITMEPITTTTATATPCFHVFNTAALATWVSSGHHTCPDCRSQIATT